MNAEIQRLADKHGLENEQVQAAIWVGIRGELLGLEQTAGAVSCPRLHRRYAG